METTPRSEGHAHRMVEAPAWRFCRDCGRVWDDEFPGVHFMTLADLAAETAAYLKES